MSEQSFKEKCFYHLCIIVRNDEALNVLEECCTVNDSDFNEANEFLGYVFSKFDFIENFIPNQDDEDIREIYRANYDELYTYLKMELIK